jgi:hypothetical protein
MEEKLTLNIHKQNRIMVLKRILEGHLSVAEAAALLIMAMRQARRLWLSIL